ncbi:MAG: L,D-transpeptidase family protein [Candidatus Uhrbacteria bacterium]|nr:L,D-transpeptidase family protein [Candidatus Uhrbacteria bacterium]
MKSALLNGLIMLALLGGMILVLTTSIRHLHSRNAPPVYKQGSVEIGEPEIQTLDHAGCVERIKDLPPSSLYQGNDQRLWNEHLIVVLKSVRRLMFFQGGSIRHDRVGGIQNCWKIALGVNRHGQPTDRSDKQREGDRRTPEGWFRTSDKPWSSFYHAILVHYPSVRHAQKAHKDGRIDGVTLNRITRAELNAELPPQDSALGGNILIHGGGSSQDWTWGCIALTNQDLDELRSLLPKGMKTWILILP